MIDHLLRFADEAAAQAALPSYYVPKSDDGPGAWRGDVCIENVLVYIVTGQTTITDPDTGQSYQQDVRQVFPGWFVWITCPTLMSFGDLPDGALRVAADYEAWAKVADGWTWEAGDRSWIVALASDVDPAMVPVIQFDRAFAREKPYPFGVI